MRQIGPKFHAIVGLSDFKDTAFIIDRFITGLKDEMRKAVLGSAGKLTTIDEYYEVTARLDGQASYGTSFGHTSYPPRQFNNFRRRNIRQVATQDSDITIQKLSPAERDKLRREGKCFKCRKSGHMARECPTRGPPSRTVRQMEVVHEEPAAEEDVSVGRIVAMMTKLPLAEKETLTKRMVDEGF